MGGFNCPIPGIITENIDMTGGDCSTAASPHQMGIHQPSNKSFVPLVLWNWMIWFSCSKSWLVFPSVG